MVVRKIGKRPYFGNNSEKTITIATLFHYAKEAGINLSEISKPKQINDVENLPYAFWSYDNNDKLIIKATDLYRLLEAEGYCNVKLGDGYVLSKLSSGHIISEVSKDEIIYELFQKINALASVGISPFTVPLIEEAVRNKLATLFSDTQLASLPRKEINILRDEKNACYLFFKNGTLKITTDSMTLIPYSEIHGYVWKSKIIDRDFVVSNSNGVFADFIRKVSGETLHTDWEKRHHSLKSIVGYLVHNYKGFANTKAVILMDEQLSDAPSGGTGKGLLLQGIKSIRQDVTIDGKKFTGDGQFIYQ